MQSPIFGPSYVSRSLNLADQQCINLYPELVETKTGKQVGALFSTPGLRLLTSVGPGPIRALYSTRDVLYAVSGNQIYAVYPLGPGVSPVFTGYCAAAGNVTIIDDGQHIGFFMGSQGFLQDGSGIEFPFQGTEINATAQDGFGILCDGATTTLWQSNLLDFRTWDPLNFANADSNPDRCVAVYQIHRYLYVLKELHTEIWTNTGTAGFSFQRIDSIYIENGILAPGSIGQAGEGLLYLGRNAQGERFVVEVNNFSLNRVSTHGLEEEFASYSRADDATAYCYMQAGHQFYVLTFPTAGTTWVYDVTESKLSDIPMWHRRASFANGVMGRHVGNAAAAWNSEIIVGDYRNGNLYVLDPAVLTDNGAARRWVRSWRARQQVSYDPERYDRLQVDFQTGIGVADGSAPFCTLRHSDDGGHRWSSERYAAIGPTGATAKRVRFNRLGSTRRNHGLDRIFELSSADAFPAVLIGADVA